MRKYGIAILQRCIYTTTLATCMLLTVTNASVWAQSVRILSTKDGFPQSFISGLVQDQDGFIWVGTRNGLARYDGLKCKVFQHAVHDNKTIASNVVVWITKDHHNFLWVQYESGEFDKIDPRTEAITHFADANVKKISGLIVRRGWLVDRSGDLWRIVIGNGLIRTGHNQQTTTTFNTSNHKLLNDSLRGILEDKSGQIWVVSQHYLSLYDNAAKLFQSWAIPYAQDVQQLVPSPEEGTDLHQRQNGELMWGDREHLLFFNPVKKAFRYVPFPGNPTVAIRWIRTGPTGQDYFESKGIIYSYDEKNGLVTISNAELRDPADARSLLVDRSSVVWVGTNAGGIHQLDLMTPFFKSHKYTPDLFQNILQENFSLSLVKTFNWTEKANSFSAPGYHLRSVYDSLGNLWLGLKETVCYYDVKKKTAIVLPHVPLLDDQSNTGIAIKGITMAPGGKPMVIGYNGHILIYNFLTKNWEPFIDPGLIYKQFGTTVLPQDIYYDGTKVWISTAMDGLLVLDAKTKVIEQIRQHLGKNILPTNQLLVLCRDPTRKNLLWIGSYQGLICLDKTAMTTQVFSVQQGLPDNTIYSILSDESGKLWFGTNKGLCRFDPITHAVRVFNTPYGLPGDEFNRFHQLKLTDGRLAFGGPDGWTIFNPHSISDDNFEPDIALTGLKVNNLDIVPDTANSVIRRPINAIDKLTLSYEQNTLDIAFAGLQYNQPQDILYRYQLVGYDDDWVLSGHMANAYYTRIPAGDYTFKVNATNSSGHWSSHVKVLPLHITGPWWGRWWAYLCYALIASSVIWSYIRYRVNRELLTQELSLKDKESIQLREIDEMKTRFFSNVTHEFRTPLTLILGPALQLKSLSQEDSKQGKLAGIIEKNAEQLLNLINQLMDLSKLEAKALKPKERKGNVATTVGTIVTSFQDEAKSKDVKLLLEMPETGAEYWFAQEALERIVYNLISNALKFTPPGGWVEVILTTGPDGIELIIRDTGIGIEEEKLPYIFNRFYQADHGNSGLSPDRSGMEGTGIGLALVKELVEIQEGSIEVFSRKMMPGQASSGTIFTIFLPYPAIEALDSREDTLSEPVVEKSDERPLLLVVEDNSDLADYVTGILSESYRVIHEENGMTGLRAAVGQMPDLIISDVLMPVMDGFEFCGKLKTDMRTSHIPVILLTAKITQEDRLRGLSNGANDYITKPFHPSELLLRVQNSLSQQLNMRNRVYEELNVSQIEKNEAIQDRLPPDPFLDKVFTVLDEHLENELFGVEDLTDLLGMSRTSLHRKVKAIANLSTTELIRNYRLKKACQFLKEGHGSTISAYKSGFSSPAYFTRCFRELYGVTPGDYLRKLI
ncbi:MAG TPA: ATP-binding protein [Mucilaginibacter sp.]